MTSTVVVLLSRDAALIEALAAGLQRYDPEVEVQVVRNYQDLQEHLKGFYPDALLVDLECLDGKSVKDLFNQIPPSEVPTIVFDDQHDEAHEDEALRAGAACWFPKTDEYVERLGEVVLQTRLILGAAGRVEETEQHYRDILEASSDGIFVLVDRVFRYVNESFATAVGRDPEALIGKCGLVELSDTSQQRFVAEEIARIAVSDASSGLVEMTLPGPAGPRVFEASCRSSVVEGQRAVVGVARDVTAVRELQAEIEKTRQRATNVERLRALGELAAGVAHDFNNALGTVIGRVELAREKLGRGQPIADELRVVERVARSAAKTVERIQEVSRPTETEAWTDVDLTAVVRDAAEFVSTRVPPGVEVALDARATPRIRGSDAELREVLLNLLHNALDAVGEGGCVALSCLEEEGRAVVVVEDDGEGIPEKLQKRVFEPFFSTKGSEGTGLGLSVSHWILRRHDAQIRLQSRVGEGTRFRLVFAPFEPTAATQHRLAKKKLSILVVDDDEGVREMISDLLAERGHQVTAVDNAAAAARILGERRDAADVIITDLDLPDLSGWQLARRMRELRPDILVGMITGWPLGISESELRGRGVDFILGKPFTIDELNHALYRIRG